MGHVSGPRRVGGRQPRMRLASLPNQSDLRSGAKMRRVHMMLFCNTHYSVWPEEALMLHLDMLA